MLDDILSQVYKPGRYIGQEWNTPKKDFTKSEIKFALCFPDLYEIGMSNLGTRIIYAILNNLPGVSCERFFSPGMDMENILRNHQLEIFSLESKRKPKEFDFLGFSLGYELDYTNVLNILELGNIPLNSSRRDCRYPLVIGGGPCVLNPEPLHEFFDLFLLGEAEEAILEIIEVYRKFKQKFKSAKMAKEDLLAAFSQIEGVYVPSLYNVIYNREARIEEFQPKIKGLPLKIKKRFLRNLDSAYFPSDWLTPYIQIVHDRITLEVMRGCPNRCRFCQARSQYYPYRERGVKDLIDLSCRLYQRSGYEELSLAGLSVSDYSKIEELTKALVDLFAEKGVGVSLPSLKPKTVLGNLSGLIASIKKTGLTFAPEVATEKLRRMLNKDFDLQDFFKLIEKVYLRGYKHLKLYFMVGLPYERDNDLDAIIEFALSVSRLKEKIDRVAAGVNLSVNTFIPKPHTPFQWFGMQDLEGMKYKQGYLKKGILKNKKLRLGFHNPYMSFLEGVLSRGDRRLSRVIASAFKKGARFDAWDDYFVFNKWLDAFSESQIDPLFYLQEKSENEILPWDFLDIGIKKETLRQEFEQAKTQLPAD